MFVPFTPVPKTSGPMWHTGLTVDRLGGPCWKHICSNGYWKGEARVRQRVGRFCFFCGAWLSFWAISRQRYFYTSGPGCAKGTKPNPSLSSLQAVVDGEWMGCLRLSLGNWRWRHARPAVLKWLTSGRRGIHELDHFFLFPSSPLFHSAKVRTKSPLDPFRNGRVYASQEAEKSCGFRAPPAPGVEGRMKNQSNERKFWKEKSWRKKIESIACCPISCLHYQHLRSMPKKIMFDYEVFNNVHRCLWRLVLCYCSWKN